jgi:uncharacterized protein (TIGR00297 family)
VIIAAAAIGLFAAGAYLIRAVTISGAIAGWGLATALYHFAGWQGLLLLALLFLLATLATRMGCERKRALGIEQAGEGRRSAAHVLANVAVGLLFAILAELTALAPAYTVAMVAAFATAACDTVSSEVGKAFGKSTLLVTTMRPVEPGTPGAVSPIGTLAGLAAALLLSLAAWWAGLTGLAGLSIVTVAAFIGALVESFLHATLLAGRSLGHLANLVNTLIGALLALGLIVLAG